MTISTMYLKPMLIEKYAPQHVGSIFLKPRGILILATLERCLEQEAERTGIDRSEIKDIISLLDSNFLQLRCYFDLLLKEWQYEIDTFHILNNTNQRLSGNNIWHSIKVLLSILYTAYMRLNKCDFSKYIKKLLDLKKHKDGLVEIYPLLRVNNDISIEHEVKGYGHGNTDIDWLLKLPECLVLIEVKNRIKDLYTLMDRIDCTAPPIHDPTLLFQSVEKKFNNADPDKQLQGVWISTDVKQDFTKVTESFNKLDRDKVHFAILGDYREDAFILAGRIKDKKLLTELFKLTPSTRFIYTFP